MPSVLLTTRSLDLACFMTSGKVVGRDFAVSRKHVYNFSLASLQFFTAEFTNSSLDAGEFTNSSLVSLQILRW